MHSTLKIDVLGRTTMKVHDSRLVPKARKFLEKTEARPCPGKHACLFWDISKLQTGTSQGLPGVFSRVFAAFESNHEYDSLCLSGSQYSEFWFLIFFPNIFTSFLLNFSNFYCFEKWEVPIFKTAKNVESEKTSFFSKNYFSLCFVIL